MDSSFPFPRRTSRFIARYPARPERCGVSTAHSSTRECVGDDLRVKGVLPFTRAARSKTGETVVFSWIVYKSRAHRDRVNAKVMKDPRLAKMMDPKSMPFDLKRMVYGGFKVVVDV